MGPIPAPAGIEEAGKASIGQAHVSNPVNLSSQTSNFNHQVLIEYVWMGSSGSELRSKTRVLDSRPASVEELPMIVVDGR